MFVALLLMVMVRFAFWAIAVSCAVVFAFAAILAAIARGICEPFSPQRADDFHDVATILIHHAFDVSKFADNHRRWLLPNTQRSRRY